MLRLTKFHGLGNDFLIALAADHPDAEHPLTPDPDVARALCARHTGIGADGLIYGLAPGGDEADVHMVLLNADGSEAEISGNGIRCLGQAGLRAMGSPKRDRLIENLDQVVRGQGDRVVVFSFFSDTIIPLLADDLRNAGFEVALNTGSMTQAARQASIDTFRSGGADVFLSSDAGSKGLNLPEALYVDNFELPPTIANYIQRINRNNRIDSPHPSVTCRSYITPNTVEEGLRYLMLSRNEYHDTMLEDGDDGRGFISAADRRKLIDNAFKVHDLQAATAA